MLRLVYFGFSLLLGYKPSKTSAESLSFHQSLLVGHEHKLLSSQSSTSIKKRPPLRSLASQLLLSGVIHLQSLFFEVCPSYWHLQHSNSLKNICMQNFGFSFQQFPSLHFQSVGNTRLQISVSSTQMDWGFMLIFCYPRLTIGKYS